MSNNPNLPESENTVDLLALCINACKSIGRGLAAMFKGIGVAIAACVGFVVRHFFLLLGAGVCGLVIIIILSGQSSVQHQYVGEAQLFCNVPLQNIEIEVDKLGQLALSRKSSTLASLLDIDIELSKKIHYIQFGYGMDIDDDGELNYTEYNKQLSANVYTEKILKGGQNSNEQLIRTPVKIKVNDYAFLKILTNTSSTEEFKKIGHAVCHYLNQRPVLQTMLQLKRMEIETEMAEVEIQKDMLDSLLRIEYFINSKLKAASFAQGSSQLVLADYKVDGSGLNGTPVDYKDIIHLTQQKNALNTRLAKANDVVVIQSDFVPHFIRTRTFKIRLLVLWMTCFVVGALIYDFRKPLGEYIRRQRQK